MRYINWPAEDEKVQRFDSIGGHIFENKKLQVYVLANDGRYYLQDPVIVSGNNWSCACGFGDGETQAGDIFYAILVESGKRPHSPVNELTWPTLDYIRVQRAA